MQITAGFKETVSANWHLGITCFGGTAVHFQTFHERFVEDLRWIDEPMFQQIFCLSQSLPGSSSMKMLLCINTVRNGLASGFLAILMFSLPGAIGMYGFALGVGKMQSKLPDPAYATLSGLNASAVALIAFAAVELSRKAITDKISRALVLFSAVGGMLYAALWYYPLLMMVAGVVTLLWDLSYTKTAYRCCTAGVRRIFRRARPKSMDEEATSDWDTSTLSDKIAIHEKPLPELPPPAYVREDIWALGGTVSQNHRLFDCERIHSKTFEDECIEKRCEIPSIPRRIGAAILLVFGVSFILIITLHAVLDHQSRAYELLSSLYLAGTIIFGGGPVVTPLLREYIVTPGWVSPRNFLLGFSVFQAFPGPGFNFAVYLGALAVAGSSCPSYAGAVIAYFAMYIPGTAVIVGFMGIWRIVSQKQWFHATLRGINAAAVGLVFTAVWKLWQIGNISGLAQNGSPLGMDPWLVGIAAVIYVGSAWWRLNPPAAILLGGILGIARYGVTNT